MFINQHIVSSIYQLCNLFINDKYERVSVIFISSLLMNTEMYTKQCKHRIKQEYKTINFLRCVQNV